MPARGETTSGLARRQHYPEIVNSQRAISEYEPLPVAQHRLRTLSPAGTQAVASALASWVEPGDVVVLTGDLGAGKTTFTQGLAQALGVTVPVTSPTFTIASHYQGTCRDGQGASLAINHLDVYRLGSLDEAEELGLDELLDGGAVTLIEWGEMIEPLLPHERLTLNLQLAPLTDRATSERQHDDAEGSCDDFDRRTIGVSFSGHDRRRRVGLERVMQQAVDHVDTTLECSEPC